MLNVIESRVIQRTWREWEPTIIYVQHQSSPFPTRIWLPPFADPVGLRVPPIMRDVADIRSELVRVRSLLDRQDGTIGRLRTDSALVRAVHRDFAALDSLFADLKKHPLRYIAF